jgi:hypothetical protein
VRRSTALLVAAAAAGALLLFAVGGSAVAGKSDTDPLAAAAKGQLRAAKLVIKHGGKTITRTMPFFSPALVNSAAEALGDADRVEAAGAGRDLADTDFGDIGGGKETLGCARRDDHGNTRVNQDCTFRRQAEEDITYDPSKPDHLVAGQNDSRVGFNQCGIDYSIDNGNTWGDLLPPFRSRLNAPEFMGPSEDNPNDNTIAGGAGDFHSYDAASDPANAVDSQGRSYFSCVVFNIAYISSGVFVTQSPQGADGSFYYNVPTPPEKRFMAVEDNTEAAEHDKNMISADRYASSPNRDNVYLTWTVFNFRPDCNPEFPDQQDPAYCSSMIYGTMSTDHGVSWSTPEIISGSSATLCFFGNFFDPNASPHACDLDQGSYSVALPDGSLEVIFNNGNTAPDNPNAQQLGVHCMPSGDSSAGTAHLNCVEPAKVGDDVVHGEPQCDFGRGPEECIPGPYIRTNDYPRITKDNTQNNHLYAVWQDYRNGEFDIQMSQSLDGGLTWHEAGTVNPDTGLDHYMPATDQSPDNKGDDKGGKGGKGDRNGVSYYRSERVPNENTTPEGGFAPCEDAAASSFSSSEACQPGVGNLDSDYVVAGGTGDNTPYDFTVVSPVFPPPDGLQSGFNGDYSGLTINRGQEAHPLWSDTRNADPFAPNNGVLHDEDVFTDKVGLPGGKAKQGPGKIGKEH